MDDAELRPIVERLPRIIFAWAGPTGFGEDDLRRRCDALDDLEPSARFRCYVLLAKSEYIGTRGNSYAGWHFWARHHAPKDAFVGRGALRDPGV